MNTDNSDDDFELMKIVDQRIAAAVEDHNNSRRREHHLVTQHPSENLSALGPHNNTKSTGSHNNDGFDLMGIVAQRAADARAAIDSEQAPELGFPKPHKIQDNIPIPNIGMTSLRRMRNVIAEFVQPGAYPVDGIGAPLQEEGGSPGSDNEGENWEEEDIQAVAYPIDHQGTEELLPSGVPFIARSRTTSKRKLLRDISLQIIFGMLIVSSFLVVFVAVNRIIRSGESTSQSVTENGVVRVPVLPAATQAPISSSSIHGLLASLNLPDCTLEALQDHRSPQHKAYEWMLDNQLSIQSYPNWRLTQLFVLATFFFSTRGDSWVNHHGWLDWDVHECSWEQRSLTPDYMRCDDSGHIRGLSFVGNKLDGTIPPELSLLSADLEVLELPGNMELKGQIPTEIGLLTKLTELVELCPRNWAIWVSLQA
ncbi:Leucine Rich Repeat [Seminavis robusta]|uniref:Leucine Rich Repeat n=1 Tax=Seminavis robusta TaxID=568900 RepID=A0A9N8H5E8_9STRA|nr:Leucine Rich Repeat [Seminavis robusta]|eukprot:Sro112_g055620.1 Leucine Rich Repeat (424) ;mRNA; f:43818-45183